MKYILISDDSGHDYVIPSIKSQDWYKWLSLLEEDINLPNWAKRVEKIEFENPSVNGKPLFEEIEVRTFCVKVDREFKDDQYIFHFDWGLVREPDREDVLGYIELEGIRFDEKYHEFEFWKI